MKRISKYAIYIGVALCGMTLPTGCIDETEPTDIATEGQISQSSAATEALTQAMPAFLIDVDEDFATTRNWHAAFGYPAMMIIRDLMTGDYGYNNSNYSTHFDWACTDKYLGDGYIYSQYIWNYYYQLIQTANNVVGAVTPESATDEQLGYLGTGLAYRALAYIDMARMYEFLPNEKTSSVNSSGNDVLGLTVPIVTDTTTAQQAGDNPRATREKMVEFIQKDLDNAEQYITHLTNTGGKTLPDLACVYGLKARLYMWTEDYANAERYARLAIDNASVSPMSQSEALNTTTGFNSRESWMWGATQTANNRSVTSGIVNWTSWVSNQTSFGYTGSGTSMYVVIDKNLYDHISRTDWRKLEFQPTDDSGLKSSISYTDESHRTSIPTYASLKFRPGSGDGGTSSTGAMTDIPIMRVEEMYFIEAEAAAHQDASRGVSLLTSFMQQYRDPSYTCRVSSTDDVVEEIVLQKRIELWGEGQSFFDIKRLGYSVTRGYDGTPFFDLSRLNTNGRPAWMNIVIIRSEQNNNKALVGWNNPDPSDLYTPWTE